MRLCVKAPHFHFGHELRTIIHGTSEALDFLGGCQPFGHNLHNRSFNYSRLNYPFL